MHTSSQNNGLLSADPSIYSGSCANASSYRKSHRCGTYLTWWWVSLRAPPACYPSLTMKHGNVAAPLPEHLVSRQPLCPPDAPHRTPPFSCTDIHPHGSDNNMATPSQHTLSSLASRSELLAARSSLEKRLLILHTLMISPLSSSAAVVLPSQRCPKETT